MEILKKPLDKYRLNQKIFYFGNLVWTAMISMSKLMLILFILMTCFVFWQIMAVGLYNQEINLLKPIYQMLKAILIGLCLIIIDEIFKLILKLRRKDEGTNKIG